MADTRRLIAEPTQDEIDRLRGFKIVKWRTYDNYVCLHCQYATLWPNKMEKHQAEGEHPWAYPGQNPRANNDPGPDIQPDY